MAFSEFQTLRRVPPRPVEGREPKRRATLVPQGGEGNPFAVDLPAALVGRGSDSALCLADPQVSRHHARILAVHNRYYVQDLGSTNGTFLNGSRVRFERLAHGDRVQFGAPVYRFEIGDETDEGYLARLNLETVSSLALAVEAKDPYTRGHSERVAETAERLALALGRSPEEARRIRVAGLLHDIGKIGVPETVLLKEGRLDEEEFAAIRKHPAAGAAILEPLEFLADVIPAVRHHHERFDGRGYPDRLAGDDLPFAARVVQVADTFDAMTSDRPYRNALGADHVRREFERHAGTQFDPPAAAALLDLLPVLPVGGR